jgi:hypothetical protein
VTKRVTGQYVAYENYRTCGELCPCNHEPLHRQSEQSPHPVASWRPGRHLEIQLLTSSKVKSTNPPYLSFPSIISLPCTRSRQKHSYFQFPEADTSCFLLPIACTAFLLRCRFAILPSSSPPTSLETRLSLQTTSGFTIHFTQLPCTTFDAMRS